MTLAEQRFALIAPILRQYKRRFSVLDLGAGINPYVGQRISNEFDCAYVAIEQDEIAPEELAKFGPRAIWLRKKMSAEDLEKLSRCEHFDVVVGLNILHHYDKWWSVLNSICNMGNFAIIQTPYSSDANTCGQEITPEIHERMDGLAVTDEAEFLGESVQFEGHQPRPLYLLDGVRVGRLSTSSWTSPSDCIDATIRGDFDHKSIEIRHSDRVTLPRPYIHGLNLWNFAQLGGAWPHKEKVLQLIREFPLPSDTHGDIVPHNFLFDGAELHLIDGHEGWEFSDAEGLLKTEKMMEELL